MSPRPPQSEKRREAEREIGSYLLFGVGTTIANWLAYSGLVLVGVPYFFANIVAWAVAVLFAFVTNKRWVFKSLDHSWQKVRRELATFVGGRLFSGLFEILMLPLLVWLGFDQPLWEIDAFWAKLAVSVVVVIMNYWISKRWVFKR